MFKSKTPKISLFKQTKEILIEDDNTDEFNT